MSNPLTNPMFVKGGSAFVIAAAIDRFYFKTEDMQQNAITGAATAGGIIAGGMLGSYIPDIIGDQSGLYQGKMVSQRVVEITTTAATGYLLNSVVFKNNYDNSLWMQKLGAIILTDVAAEYATDYILGNSLGYLVN